MFKKSKRLTQEEFKDYFKIGQKTNSPNFTLVYYDKPIFKCSAVVGKKVFKLAILRNRLRRRIYAAIPTLLSGVYIVVAKPTAKTLSRLEVKDEVTKLLARVTDSR